MHTATYRAGLALAPLLLLAACDGGGSGGILPTPVAAVAIEAPTAFVARGDSMRLTATARDAQGNVIPGVPIQWSSGDPGMATVDATGMVRARDWGLVHIRASAGGRTDSIALWVPSPVGAIYFSFNPLTPTVRIGAERQLEVVVLDTTSAGVHNPSYPVAYASSDPSVATVDQDGRVRGVRAGWATISATAAGRTAQQEVRVARGYAASVLALVPDPCCSRLLPHGMNEGGDVVGIFTSFSVAAHGAFVYRDGTLHLLDFPSASEALAVNEQGQVAGWFHSDAGLRHAFLWQDGTVTDLSPDAEHHTAARDVNDAGRVAGHWADESEPWGGHALLWDGGVETDLGTLGGRRAGATAVNAAGDVAGVVDDVAGKYRLFVRRAGGEPVFREVPAGGPTVTAMNDAGVVVGTLNDSPDVKGFVWNGDQLTILPVPRRMIIVPNDVNAAGTVVGGFHVDRAFDSRWGWVLDGGKPLELSGLVEGWSISFAGAVDNVGRIAAMGYRDGEGALLLLTPLP